MCDPVTLTALTVAGTALSAGGSIAGGLSANAAGQAQAQLARQNAAVAAANAQSEEVAGSKAIDQKNQQVGAFAAKQTTEMAANGILTASGSAAQTTSDTMMLGQNDVDNVRQNYFSQIRGDYAQSNSYLNQGAIDQSSGENAEFGGFLNAGGTLLTGASKVNSIWNSGTQRTGSGQ